MDLLLAGVFSSDGGGFVLSFLTKLFKVLLGTISRLRLDVFGRLKGCPRPTTVQDSPHHADLPSITAYGLNTVSRVCCLS